MKKNCYIFGPAFNELLSNIIQLGIKNDGRISRDLYNSLLSNKGLKDYQLRMINDKLKENNIIIYDDYDLINNSPIFIDDEFSKEVEQIDRCLSYDELSEYFLAEYDEKLTKEEKKEIYHKLANRTKHVENCDECQYWCRYGHSLWQDICCNSIPFPNEKFFNEFSNDYQKHLKKIESIEQFCKQNGHDYDEWMHREWVTKKPKDGIYGLFAAFDEECLHHEWSRTCKRCGHIEKKDKEPADFKGNRVRIKIKI